MVWFAARQDRNGGWRRYSAFTPDGAQCVLDGFNTYEKITGDDRFRSVIVRAADRMVSVTLTRDGRLRLADVIEIGEYAHFALVAWKTTGKPRFKQAGERIVAHIDRNFDKAEGMWRPFVAQARRDVLAQALHPVLRSAMTYFPLRGRLVARISEHMAPFAVSDSYPQYSMSLMDAEALLDTLDGSCEFPRLKKQTSAAVAWAENHCRGPFPGILVESKKMNGKPGVYPLSIINDTRTAALWPTTCLLIAYCGMHGDEYRAKALRVADWILTVQDQDGGFSSFQDPNGSKQPLQSGNVNFYASMHCGCSTRSTTADGSSFSRERANLRHSPRR